MNNGKNNYSNIFNIFNIFLKSISCIKTTKISPQKITMKVTLEQQQKEKGFG